jgi:hypothetical protein
MIYAVFYIVYLFLFFLKELRHFNWNKCRYYRVIKHYHAYLSRAPGLTYNFLVRSVLLIICFCVVLLYVFTFWVPCCASVAVSVYERCSVCVTSSCVYEGSCLIDYVCLFAHSDVQRILCCVFVLFVFILCTPWC